MWWLIPVSLVLVLMTFGIGMFRGAKIAEEREARMRQRWIAERAEFGPARAAGTIMLRQAPIPEPRLSDESLEKIARLSRP